MPLAGKDSPHLHRQFEVVCLGLLYSRVRMHAMSSLLRGAAICLWTASDVRTTSILFSFGCVCVCMPYVCVECACHVVMFPVCMFVKGRGWVSFYFEAIVTTKHS